MTEPLSPSQEAAVQEAIEKLYERFDKAARDYAFAPSPTMSSAHWVAPLSLELILRDLARRLLEPANPQEKSE